MKEIESNQEYDIIEDDPVLWAMVFNFGRGFLGNPEVRELWKSNYLDYIKSKPWKILSERIKQQRGNKCQLCSKTNNIQVHHNTYKRLGKEEDNDLIVLCESCHIKFHRVF